jgi:hypothetical protein
MREVTKEEYEEFIKNYPRPLSQDLLTITEPPILQLNDFSLGDWPKSVVAQNRNKDYETDEVIYKISSINNLGKRAKGRRRK